MKKLIAFSLVTAISFFTPLTVHAADISSVQADPAPEAVIKYYIPWPFSIYETPDFTAAVMGQDDPQSVLPLEIQDDGWALIDTDIGPGWVYLAGDRIYINRETPLYNSKDTVEPVTTLSPQTVNVIERDDNWLLIETWNGSKWLNLDEVSEADGTAADTSENVSENSSAVSGPSIQSDVLLDVPAYNQRELGYDSGCEIVSVAMMINYEREADIDQLVSEMPYSYDPRLGYRGNPRFLSSGFTILPSALLDLTSQYLGQAIDMTGCSMDDLKRQLNSGCPIVAWVNGLGFNVHAVCLTGYDDNGFYYNDPWCGSKNAFITYESFYQIWNCPITDENNPELSYPVRLALSYSNIS